MFPTFSIEQQLCFLNPPIEHQLCFLHPRINMKQPHKIWPQISISSVECLRGIFALSPFKPLKLPILAVQVFLKKSNSSIKPHFSFFTFLNVLYCLCFCTFLTFLHDFYHLLTIHGTYFKISSILNVVIAFLSPSKNDLLH